MAKEFVKLCNLTLRYSLIGESNSGFQLHIGCPWTNNIIYSIFKWLEERILSILSQIMDFWGDIFGKCYDLNITHMCICQNILPYPIDICVMCLLETNKKCWFCYLKKPNISIRRYQMKTLSRFNTEAQAGDTFALFIAWLKIHVDI